MNARPLSGFVEAWSEWLAAASWQVAIVVVAVVLLDRLLRRLRRPGLRYGLWMLVAVKLVLPPSLPSPVAMFAATMDWLPARDVSAPAAARSVETIGGPGTGSATVVPFWWLFGIWSAGVVLSLGSIARRSHRLRLAVLDHARAAPDSVLRAAQQVAGDLGLRRCPVVVLSDGPQGPFVLGPTSSLRRLMSGFRTSRWSDSDGPMVVLPGASVARWSSTEFAHVLAHELAHVRRRDLSAETFFAVVNAFFWFHPLVYFARYRAHALRELCCDAAVARLFGDAYRKTLVRAAAASLLGAPGPLAAAFRGRSGQMIERLKALDGQDFQRRKPSSATATAALLVAASLGLPMARPTILPAGPLGNSPDLGLNGPSGSGGSGGPGGEGGLPIPADLEAPNALEMAEARRAAGIAVADGPGIGSLHVRYAIQRLNNLEARQAGSRAGDEAAGPRELPDSD